MKKKIYIYALLCLFPLMGWAQTNAEGDTTKAEERPFDGILVNAEEKIKLTMNLYEQDIKIPGEADIYGDVPGYISSELDWRKWIVVNATVEGSTARLDIINDYGSEGLTATLKMLSDGSYVLKQEEGSPIKFGIDNKWVKIPKKVVFQRKH